MLISFRYDHLSVYLYFPNHLIPTYEVSMLFCINDNDLKFRLVLESWPPNNMNMLFNDNDLKVLESWPPPIYFLENFRLKNY